VVNAVDRAWALLERVPDPEIPVVSIRELGILREISERDGQLEVVITPTYSGCPAMEQIQDDVRIALAGAGLRATVVARLAPPWTTDWMTRDAKDKLRAYGIAPPGAASQAQQVVRFAPRCPRCGSLHTVESSPFGSTPCKALHKCLDCLEPFDHFKPY
jgi:ring-1,2-phenylacetyl-CoA epoxidase subunit PaaD